MLRVDVGHAKPEMVLALPVRHPSAGDRVLLMAGYRLSTEVINKLRHMGVRDVWIRYPGLEEINRFVDPAVLERRAGIARQLEKNLEQIQKQSTARLPYEQYVAEMASLVQDLLNNRTAALFMDEAGGADPSLLEHSTTVSFIALLMGLKLDAYLIRQRKRLPGRHAKSVGNLGVGAMLHDVGMLRLDEEVAARFRKTRNTEDAAWRAHTRLGYELVRGHIEPSAAVVVLDHHQHFDGTGFPMRRTSDGRSAAAAGESIHIFCRITAVADTFDELRHPAEGVKLPSVRAMAQMLRDPVVRWFDPNVLKAFFQVVPPYPPGSPVKLSDGRWAVPIEHSVSDPCRPRVQIIQNPAEAGRITGETAGDTAAPSIAPEMIDLAERSDLHVAFAEDQNVAADNFKLPRELLGEASANVTEAPEAVAHD